jgi:protein phosphatase-4 regulatory subunit 3
MLPSPDLGNLAEIENRMRAANGTQAGREALAKFVINDKYIPKLIPLVEMAEDLESLSDLHRLCSIMKILILLNDNTIIEYAVTDEVLLGVVGALECMVPFAFCCPPVNLDVDDPDFPLHKANHRQYLSDESKFKEVVRIRDENVKRKIHHTYRLQYLKDVVLARILDDPTFSILNSLIYFNQLEIVNYMLQDSAYLEELFGVIRSRDQSEQRKRDAVLMIQQCCATGKSLQQTQRAQLYMKFVEKGVLDVIPFALKHHDASVRVAGADILIGLLDHDSNMVRIHNFKALRDKGKPLTDTLIELFLVEVDLGVKAHIAEALKALLDPTAVDLSAATARLGGASDPLGKLRSSLPAFDTDTFIQEFYEQSVLKLFQPFKDLEGKEIGKFRHV